jgi:hypothetical protein
MMDMSESNGSLAASQFWLLLRVRYAALRGWAARSRAALFFARKPQARRIPTETPKAANGITKPMLINPLQHYAGHNQH